MCEIYIYIYFFHICRGALVFTCAQVCACQRQILVVPLPSLPTLFTESGRVLPLSLELPVRLLSTARLPTRSPRAHLYLTSAGLQASLRTGPYPWKVQALSTKPSPQPNSKSHGMKKVLNAIKCHDQKNKKYF